MCVFVFVCFVCVCVPVFVCFVCVCVRSRSHELAVYTDDDVSMCILLT